MFSTPESWTSKAIKEMILTILTTVFSPSYTSIQLCFSHPDLLAKLAKWDQFPRFSTLQLPETRLSKMFRKSGEKWPTLFEKSNFCPKIQYWQTPNIFTSFSPKFLTIFLVKSKLSTVKKSKTTTFSRFFHQNKKSTIFSGNQSWIFGQKMKISNSVC